MSDYQYKNVTAVEPFHNAEFCGHAGMSRRSVLSYAAISVDIARTVVHRDELSHHSHRIPFGAFAAGNIFLRAVIIGIDFLTRFYVSFGDNVSVLVGFCGNFNFLINGRSENILNIHFIPLVVMGIAHY